MIVSSTNYQDARVLIWGKTYPELSSKYLETVCTGGVFEDGTPARLYPISLRYLEGEEQFSKYQWITVRLKRNPQDGRPESYKVDRFAPITVGEKIPSTPDEWGKRADVMFKDSSWIFDSVEDLQKAERETGRSLGVVEPKEILKVTMRPRPDSDAASFAEKLERLKRENEAMRSQVSLFEDAIPEEMRNLEFVTERVQIEWRCNGSECKGHKMQVLDWEAGEMLRRVGSEKTLQRVQEVCDLSKYALKFFLGNLAQHPTSFMIGGIWYPQKNNTPRLF